MKRVGTWVAAVSLALVALALAVDTERTSPGPLASVHARERELTSADACGACHGGVFETMADACMECHVDIELRIDGALGVHGQLADAVADDCGSCHREHHGEDFRMVDPAVFAMAGIPDVDEYAHEGLDYRLDGAHALLTCESCHPQALEPVLALGSQRFLGVDQDCTTCHEDEHEGANGTDCVGCHGQELPFALVGGAAHQAYSPMEGAHADIECTECHIEGTRWSVPALVERHVDPSASPAAARGCNDCHASPHTELFVRGVARMTRGEPWAPATDSLPADDGDDELPVALAMPREPIATVEPTGLVCSRCHSPSDEHGFLASPPTDDPSHDLSRNLAMADDWHKASGFALVAPHDELRCEDCHAGLGTRAPAEATISVLGAGEEPVDFSGFDADYPGRGPDACHACHGDPHEGQFERGPFDGVGCLGCHERLTFDPPLFDVEHHERTAFALEGSHAAAECNACHLVPEGRPERTADGMVTRAFSGTQSACAECHTDPHSLDFLDGVTELARLAPDQQTCTVCHDAVSASFVGGVVRLTDELHAASGFELVGPHGEPACVECHEGYAERKVVQAYGTGLGRAADVDGDPGHAPGFVGPRAAPPSEASPIDAPPTTAALAFGQAPDSFAINAFAQRLLAEVRGTPFVPRQAEEGQGSLPDAVLVAAIEHTFADAYPGRPADGCQSCHEDPHEDQFERGSFAPEGCLACHDRAAFVPNLFAEEHHARTSFPLTGSHLAVGCNECHLLPEETPTEQLQAMGIVPDEARIFVDTPAVCSACHEDVHDGHFDQPGLPVRVAGRESCARCHVTEAFAEFVGGRFDHGLWSGFQLEGAHGQLDCTECHVPKGTPDEHGRTFGTAKGTSCTDCHTDHHVGQFAVAGTTDCTRCHVVGSGFDELVFDHQVDSVFVLDENHIQRACNQCHKPYPLIGGGEAVRYKPLGTECRDCHDPSSLPPGDPRRAR